MNALYNIKYVRKPITRGVDRDILIKSCLQSVQLINAVKGCAWLTDGYNLCVSSTFRRLVFCRGHPWVIFIWPRVEKKKRKIVGKRALCSIDISWTKRETPFAVYRTRMKIKPQAQKPPARGVQTTVLMNRHWKIRVHVRLLINILYYVLITDRVPTD